MKKKVKPTHDDERLKQLDYWIALLGEWLRDNPKEGMVREANENTLRWFVEQRNQQAELENHNP